MKSPQPIIHVFSHPSHVFDPAMRVALWCAYHLLLAWWFLRRPNHYGAVVAIWVGPQILMIRHSYRRNWLSWPGGSVRRGEAPLEAARRELREETGLNITDDSLRFVGRVLERWEWRYDYVSLFELRLKRAPSLHLDGCEVIDAKLMSRKAALAQPLVPFIRTYLENRASPGH